MIDVSLLTPLDQPLNNVRLADIVENSMNSEAEFHSLRFVVAYAKSGILKRLSPHFEEWKRTKKSTSLMVGIDQKVTSKEALEKSLSLFEDVYLINHKSVTFHPKMYLFKNDTKGRVIVGSNNLTSGGLEMNFESAAVLDYNLQNDEERHSFETIWNSTEKLLSDEYGIAKKLDSDLVKRLHAEKLLAIETKVPGVVESGALYEKRSVLLNELFGSNFTVSRTASRKKSSSKATHRQKPNTKSSAKETREIEVDLELFETFIIQIKPHHNGEIFLSKTAVNEKPDFFGFPFSGSTTPKNSKNPSYPQREPDPVVSIVVYGDEYEELLKLNRYELNTVYYTTKSEVRITCSQLVGIVPEYSIMIMSKPKETDNYDFDYELAIHTPDSPDYSKWEAVCDKKMPGGGKKARLYGWIS